MNQDTEVELCITNVIFTTAIGNIGTNQLYIKNEKLKEKCVILKTYIHPVYT